MAVNITSTYAGHALTPLLTSMFDTMTEVQNGDITLHNDVNYKKVLRKMTSANLLQADSPGFTPLGDLTETETILFPVIQKINFPVDKDDFRSEWSSQDMGKGQMNKKIAADINEAIVRNILGSVGESLRSQMWVAPAGTAFGALPTGGIKTQLLTSIAAADDDSAGHVDGTSAISSTNVLGELTKLLSAVKPKVLSFDKTRIFVAPDVWFAYSQAVGNQSNLLDSTKAVSATYGGYKMVTVPELLAGEMILGNKDNLHFGTDIFSDFGEVKVLDQEFTTGAAQIHYVQRVASDVKVGFTKETAIRTAIA